MNSVEIKDKQAQLIKRCEEIVNACKVEVREMTEDEMNEFNKNKEELKELKSQYEALKEKLRAYEEELPTDEPNKEPEGKACPKEDDKNKRNNKSMNYSILKEVRKALDNGSKNFTIETRAAGTITVDAVKDQENITVTGKHDTVVQKEYKPIIDPLYANAVIAQLGVRTYTGLPMGDVVIPKLGKGTVGWASEVAKAMKSDNSLAVATLKPHRIAAYVDISNQMLAQDNIQFEEAIRRDIENALADKIEATLFGYLAAVANERPAGLFADKTLADGTSYGKLCDLEATVEENNYTGTMKYLMSPKAKAAVRQMAKSTKSTELVLEGGMLDGTQVITTSNLPAKAFIFGAFDDIAVGYWGNIDVKIDDVTQAVYGVTRLIINAYVDFKTIRDGGLVFGTVDAAGVGKKFTAGGSYTA